MKHAPDDVQAADGASRSYWSVTVDEILLSLNCSAQGLSTAEAANRLTRFGRNSLRKLRPAGMIARLAARLRDPLILILILAALIALVVQDWINALIVLTIVAISVFLSAFQEHRASHAVEKLRQRVSAKATVLRDGSEREIPAEEVVPGDVVRLSVGSLIPADGRVLEAKDFFVSQGLLTGETFPAQKQAGMVAAGAGLSERSNCVFMGTSVRSGTARVLVVHTAGDSEFGKIAGTLALRPPETEFERGLRHFGALLMRVMLVVVIAVLGINLLLQRPPIDTLLFAMALAVGLSPELLPAILSITMAHGAQKMAKLGVIVRRLNAIENLGSMDVLCTDKTGTLTRGVVQLDATMDIDGQASERVLQLASLNSRFQTGLNNPLDEAVTARAQVAGTDLAGFHKLDEIPYDFVRKCLSIVVRREPGAEALMITKGALDNVLRLCDRAQRGDHIEPLGSAALADIQKRFSDWSAQGFRVLGLAQKALPLKPTYGRPDEADMVFTGFLLFFDPPEPQVIKTLRALRRLGVRVKIITGDNRLVARHVAEAVGISVRRIVTGTELAAMKDEALWHLAPRVTLFAEVDPNQKERIILALKKTGHVVGYLGDGINDAPALHAADVGISVDQAVDVAKEAADFVLLRHDLDVLRQGIDEGRHTFANTLKYIYITTSANFGNMISMAIASLVLPFLPLLAKQILLNNFLSDIPAMGIAGDNVDRDWERTPHRWDIRQVRNFTVTFGLVSSFFDLVTFGVLLHLAGKIPDLFRTGWFVESLLTELLIIFVVRTHKPFYRSRPGRFVLASAIAVALFTVLLPFLPLGALFGLVPMPAAVLAAIVGISVLYALASEFAKRRFFRRTSLRSRVPHGGAVSQRP